MAGFLVFFATGNRTLAFVCLLGPLQLLAWVYLMRDAFWVLMFFNALVMLTPLELLQRNYVMFGLFPGTALLLGFIAATRFLQPGDSRPHRPPAVDFLPAAVLFLWVVLAAANALQTWGWKGWASTNMLFATAVALEAIVIGWSYATVPRNLVQLRRLVYVLIVSTAFAAAAVYLLPPPRGEGGLLGGKTVVTPFGEASLNAFGTVLAAMSAMLVGLLVFEERVMARVLQVLLLVLFVVTMVLSKSRGAWFGFGIALLYVLLVSRSRRLLLVIALALIVVLSVDVLRRVLLVRVAETSARDSSLMGRLVLWFYGWRVVRDNWLLGVGMDYFRAIKHHYGFPSPYGMVSLRYNSHNLFLEILANLGVVGFGATILMLGGALRRVLAKQVRRDHAGRGLALGIGAALVALLMHGLWDAVIWQPGVVMLFAILVGLASSLYYLIIAQTAERVDSAVSTGDRPRSQSAVADSRIP